VKFSGPFFNVNRCNSIYIVSNAIASVIINFDIFIWMELKYPTNKALGERDHL